MTVDNETSSILDGVFIRALTGNPDPRGNLVEVYREQWATEWRTMQFNAVFSNPGVLRGVHVHATHFDYIVLLCGRMLLGLHDLRPESPTARLSSLMEFCAEPLAGVVIPPGVAHAFYFVERSTVLYGLSRHWDQSDEFTCCWNAKELNFAWPTRTPILSKRDASAGDYRALCAEFERNWRTATNARVAETIL